VGVSDSTPRRSTADGWVHPQRLVCRNPYKGVRKTAKTWQLGWGLPAGRKATTPFLRGRPRGPQGQSKATLRRLGTRRQRWRRVGSMARPAASGEPRDDGRWEWIRPARANTPDPGWGQTSIPQTGVPARNFATGCGITGMPTARGIPRLKPWEEVNTGQPSLPAVPLPPRQATSFGARSLLSSTRPPHRVCPTDV
jgi:hypothetical protein